MKNKFTLLIVFILLSLNAFSQKNVPEIVKKEFADKYPMARAVKLGS